MWLKVPKINYLLKRPSVVRSEPFLENDFGPGHAADGIVPAVLHPSVNVVAVETGEPVVKRRIALSVFFLDYFGREQELAEVAEDHEDEETEVREERRYDARTLERLFDRRLHNVHFVLAPLKKTRRTCLWWTQIHYYLLEYKYRALRK